MKKELDVKKWGCGVIAAALALIIFVSGIIVVVDPYFHYHAPLNGLQYPIYNERYQNYGIARHFDYDAIITGTSMTQNFKASEFDELFGVNSIKTSFAAGHLNEIRNFLSTALEKNEDVRLVVSSIDYQLMLRPSDKWIYDYDSYPWYLYDDNLLNDISYLFNKDVLLAVQRVFDFTLQGNLTTDFDSYARWNEAFEFGFEAATRDYDRPPKVDADTPLSEDEERNLFENLSQGVIELAVQYPNVEFYLFYPPYSIVAFDQYSQTGRMERFFDAERLATEQLVEYENIHLFSFIDNFDLTCNLDNYKDESHFSADISSWILQCMSEGSHQLTEDNYLDYYERVRDFYTNYDYDSVFS